MIESLLFSFSKGRMRWSSPTRGHPRRSSQRRSIRWTCGKDSWSVSLIRPASAGPPRWPAPLPTSSWSDSWKRKWKRKNKTHLNCGNLVAWNISSAFQLFSKLRVDQFWLLVCICFPAHAHLPAGWVDMDRVPLRWTESTVILHPMGCSKCRIPAPFVRNCFFMQVVFQEERPSQSGGQGQGSNRGGVQKNGAHKVRTRVCFHILCNVDWTNSTSGQNV